MVEGGGLESRCASCAYRGFESHPLRQSFVLTFNLQEAVEDGRGLIESASVIFFACAIIPHPSGEGQAAVFCPVARSKIRRQSRLTAFCRFKSFCESPT